MKQIKDVMTKDVICVDPETSLKEIVDLMKKNDIKKMPVLDSGKVIGVVRVEDLLYKKEEAPLPPILAINDLIITLPSNKTFQNKLQKLTAYKASEIMTKKFLLVDVSENVEKVITEIVEKNYGYTLVQENGKLAGIITKKDLLDNIF
jgi:acetoin utilization protein AcuB